MSPTRPSTHDRDTRPDHRAPVLPIVQPGNGRAPAAVLLADDDSELLPVLARMLAPLGCKVVTAEDGAEALARFAEQDFAILVTDLAMPKLNGLQLAERCREIKPSLPVVMVTAWDVLLSDEDLEPYGIRHVLPKPVRASNLLAAVQEALARV
jgi:CheY-like chemotaxis protein